MTPRETTIVRGALRALAGAGGAGLSEGALAEQAGTFSEMLLSSLERRALLHTLLSKGWAERFEDPLTDVPRFAITDRGRLALGAL